jgi:hypothetical protein
MNRSSVHDHAQCVPKSVGAPAVAQVVALEPQVCKTATSCAVDLAAESSHRAGRLTSDPAAHRRQVYIS